MTTTAEQQPTGFIWKPQPRQIVYLQSPVYEGLYGGSKGGGKSDALLAGGVRYTQFPTYKGIIFRRTYPKLQELIDRSHAWFKGSAVWQGDASRWLYPSGATLKFAHCQHEKDKYNYQGHEYQYMGFDQLEEFTETIYKYLIMQVRTTDPRIRTMIRATSNPGNIGHHWVKKRFIDCLDPDGQPKYFITQDDDDIEVPKGTPDALSRAFVKARVYDNPALVTKDPRYLSVLKSMPKKLRDAMLDGNYDAFEGQYFGEFDRDIHVIPYSLFKVLAEELPCIRIASLDYGFTAPASIHWHAVFPDGNVITYKELYKEGLTYEALGAKFLELSGDETIDYLVCDPAIQGDKSHHTEVKDGDVKGKSGFDILREAIGKKCAVLLADNRRIIGWTRMHDYLKPFENQHKKMTAKWRMTDNCIHLIRTLPALVHDLVNPEDVDSAGEDHAPDDGRYMIMSRPALPDAPPEKKTSGEEFWERVRADQRKKENQKIIGQSDEEDDSFDTDEGRALSED